MNRLLSTSLLLVVALFWFAGQTRGQTEAEEPCSSKKPSIGEYRNLPHGFSIIIPTGLKGYWYSIDCDSAPADCVCTDDGRKIPLAAGATIEVSAFHDPMDFEFYPPNGEHNEILELRRDKHVSHVKRLRSGWFRLGVVKVHRYAIQFRRNKETFISDTTVGLYEHEVYELTLHTKAHRYKTDKKLLEEIIASWRWTERLKSAEQQRPTKPGN